MHFFSRSRQELWRKGETSGNVMRVDSCATTATATPFVALVEPAGPACHTGERTCFYRELGGTAEPTPDAPPAEGEPRPVDAEALGGARAHAASSARPSAPRAPTPCELLDDTPLIGEKVREEAEEVTRAAREESDERAGRGGRRRALPPLRPAALTRDADSARAFEVLNGRRA